MQYTSDTPCYVVSFIQAKQKSTFFTLFCCCCVLLVLSSCLGVSGLDQVLVFFLDGVQNQREEMVLVEGALSTKIKADT